MRFCTLFLFMAIMVSSSRAQDYYYPTANTWDTTSPSDLNWCPEKLDSLYAFLESKNTKAFIVLHKGKMLSEKYFGTFTQDSAWYWASAGKSLTAFLVGKAQEQGHLSLDSSTATYLGEGWTSATAKQEKAITLQHQLSMTTGLDDNLSASPQNPDPLNCIKPACLQYETDPGKQWAYHNAPYKLVQDVLEDATGTNKNLYTVQQLAALDFRGLWLDYIFFSRPREMAKFGLLMLSKGEWNGQAVLKDTAYFNQMIRPSQNINPAYGLLWWLNGTNKHRRPRLDFDYQGEMVPNAPSDMYAAMGKNEQRIYVVPSKDLVVVRVGNATGDPSWALSSFDNALWGYLSDLECAATATKPAHYMQPEMHWANGQLRFESLHKSTICIYNLQGQMLWQGTVEAGSQSVVLPQQAKGLLVVQMRYKGQSSVRKTLVH